MFCTAITYLGDEPNSDNVPDPSLRPSYLPPLRKVSRMYFFWNMLYSHLNIGGVKMQELYKKE